MSTPPPKKKNKKEKKKEKKGRRKQEEVKKKPGKIENGDNTWGSPDFKATRKQTVYDYF